jgi:hypothetical protein
MITKDKDNLIITIPLKQDIYDPYGDKVVGQMDNISGIMKKPFNNNTYEVGFCYLIDRSYKGKSPDIGTWFYVDYMDKKKFEKLCKELGLDIYEVPVCAYCGEELWGCFTIGEKGYQCDKCEEKYD